MTATEYKDSVDLWADDAMRFAVRLCANRVECEDAVQDALISLWEHRKRVTKEKGRNYLFGTAYRRLMSRFRQVDMEQRHAQYVALTDTIQPDEGFDLREAIEHSLQTLPEVQKAILQLRDVEGYSYAEIGETLALSDSQVQVYLFRARVAMRKQLKLMGYGEIEN